MLITSLWSLKERKKEIKKAEFPSSYKINQSHWYLPDPATKQADNFKAGPYVRRADNCV